MKKDQRKPRDSRKIAAKGVSYLLSLGIIGLVYGLVIYGLSTLFTDNEQFNTNQNVIYIGLALVSAAFFYPVRWFFDKVTKKIFYRDTYDSEVFLDELNSTIVSNIELGILLRHTTKVIQENLKSDYCKVTVHPRSPDDSRTFGVGDYDVNSSDIRHLLESMANSGEKTLVTDQLGPEHSALRDLLSKNNINILTRFATSSNPTDDAMACLIIGAKQSGGVYSDQDLQIVDIISDQLLIAVQNALRFEEIQGFATRLQAEVNEATAKLQRSNKKLRDLDGTKDEFISMASHQLRTPLTSVKGYMSMVIEGDAGKLNKQQKQLLDQAFVSSQRMVYLIADLLNVSRLKTGKFIIDAHPTNLADVIEGELNQLTETARAKKIEVNYKKPKDFPVLSLDETKIRQVIMNFADNAIYYTPSGGKVKVELKEDKSHVYFRVIDNGMGVPKTDRSHLFTKFYRASNARKARPDGTGLGLFMAKKVVDAQGGNILFDSEEGKGSTFGFSFNKKTHLIKDKS